MKKPPLARRIATECQLHGVSWTDHYHWLRADNWQDCVDDPSVLPEPIKDYLNAENGWFEHVMSDTADLQTTLMAEMRGRIQDVDESLADEHGPWCYVERFEQGDEYPRYYRYARSRSSRNFPAKQSAALDNISSMQLLINFNEEASRHDYFDHGTCVQSPDHAYLAWSADTQGSERYTLRLRNLASGKDEDTIDNMYEADWAGSDFVFYTQVDDEYRPSRVYRHRSRYAGF